MGSLFDAVFSGIAALLAFCYAIVGDYALAIAMFTLITYVAGAVNCHTTSARSRLLA